MTVMPDQVWTLLRTLIRRTDRGELRWKSGSSETEFLLPGTSGSVVVASVDNDGRHPFELSLVNAEGVAVESWVTVEGNETTEWHEEVETLYEGARRAALGSTTVVKDLLDEFGEKPSDDIPF